MSVQTTRDASTEPDTINELHVGTIIETWNLRKFNEESYPLTDSKTIRAVYWNPAKTRSLKIKKETQSDGSMSILFELADISGDSVSLLDSQARY